MDAEAGAFDAGPRREIRERLERGDEFRTAVGIAGIIERVHADDDVARAVGFGPSERQRQEDRVARRHVRRRDAGGIQVAVARDVDVAGQRRSADGAQIEVELEVPLDAERTRDAPRGVDFADVPLPVANRERQQRVPVGFRDCRSRVRIESATQKDDGLHTPRVAGGQMNLCSWSCRRAGR